MTWLRRLWHRATSLLGRGRLERDLEAEIAAHLDCAAAEYEDRGMSRDAARSAALRDFGGVARAKDAYRDVRGFPFAEALLQDARFALRVLRRSPVFTAVAVLTLAMGTGVNGAVFSVADALLARPLPGIDPAPLAVVAVGQKGPAAPADYLDWKRLNASFTDLAAYRQRDANLTGAGTPERLYATEVTSDFFVTLGIGTALGRTPSSGDDSNGQVAVLTYAFWQRRFAGNGGVIGSVLDVDGRPMTVIGVTPAGLEVPMPTDIWLPLRLAPAERARRDIATLRVIGRLRPGTSVERAQAEFTTISGQLETAFPDTNRNRRAHVMRLTEYVQGTLTRRVLFLLLGCVGVVLLVAIVNIAGLQIARVASRERESILRSALGASRWRIAQLALIENLILAALGGAGGAFVASTCLGLLLRSMPAAIARLIPGFNQIQLDRRALVFMFAITMITGILAGAAPALMRSRGRLVSSSSRQRLRGTFVVGQIAAALVMLVLGLLLVRGQRELLRLHEVPDPDRVVLLNVTLPPARYPDNGSRMRFYESALQRLGSVPGVQSIATCTTPPLSNNGTTWARIEVEGQSPSPAASSPAVVEQHVSADFLQMIAVPLHAGRMFDRTDREGSVPVAVVSDALARHYWPNGDAVGKRMRVRGQRSTPWLQIVGIVGDVLYDWTDRIAEPVLYVPIAQAPAAEAVFLARVSDDPVLSATTLTREIARVDPLLPAYGVMSLRDAIAESFAGTTQIQAMMNMLAAIALVIAVIGIYGIVAYTVASRTREFGIRIALGATRADVFRLVMRHALLLSIAGISLGLVAATAAGRVTRGLVFGTSSSTAAATLIGTAIVIAATTLFAASLPARRATRTDPMNSLRVE